MMIPVANPRAQIQLLRAEIDAAIARVLDGGNYILGPEVQAFEAAFAAFVGDGQAVGVANGTDALRLALMAVGVQAGDEVITVSHSAVATVAAISDFGAIPVMVDIHADSYCIDPEAIAAAITPKTRAIVPVHIYGQPADMPAIMALAKAHQLWVVEDCAQAHGAQIAGKNVGTFGDAAAFSFYPTKNLGGVGDGGAVYSGSPDLVERVKYLRQYGWKTRYISEFKGINSRLDEMQAAILNVKLGYLSAGNQARRQIALRYKEALAQSQLIAPRQYPDQLHAMHLYVLQSEQRDALSRFLAERGIATALHYPAAIHQQAAYLQAGALPVTERLYQRLLSLPMFPELTDDQVDQVCAALAAWKEN